MNDMRGCCSSDLKTPNINRNVGPRAPIPIPVKKLRKKIAFGTRDPQKDSSVAVPPTHTVN